MTKAFNPTANTFAVLLEHREASVPPRPAKAQPKKSATPVQAPVLNTPPDRTPTPAERAEIRKKKQELKAKEDAKQAAKQERKAAQDKAKADQAKKTAEQQAKAKEQSGEGTPANPHKLSRAQWEAERKKGNDLTNKQATAKASPGPRHRDDQQYKTGDKFRKEGGRGQQGGFNKGGRGGGQGNWNNQGGQGGQGRQGNWNNQGGQGGQGGQGEQHRPKRDYDRRSGMKTGKQPYDKRGGGGQGNWGNEADELAGQTQTDGGKQTAKAENVVEDTGVVVPPPETKVETLEAAPPSSEEQKPEDQPAVEAPAATDDDELTPEERAFKTLDDYEQEQARSKKELEAKLSALPKIEPRKIDPSALPESEMKRFVEGKKEGKFQPSQDSLPRREGTMGAVGARKGEREYRIQDLFGEIRQGPPPGGRGRRGRGGPGRDGERGERQQGDNRRGGRGGGRGPRNNRRNPRVNPKDFPELGD